MEAGKFGGVALTGDAPSAMLAILEELNWPYSIDRFARCMPHFPVQFELIEIRGCLAQLGFVSQTRLLSLDEVSVQILPALVQVGESLSVLRLASTGLIVAIDPKTGAERAFKRNSRCQIVSFSAQAVDDKVSASRQPWLATTLRRFTPEILVLLGLTAVINTMVLIVSYSVMSIYDKVIPAAAYDTLAAIMFGVALASGFELSFRMLKARLIGRVTGRLEYLLSTAIFSKLISLPIQMITNTPVGDQIGRLRQFETVRDLFAGPFVAVGLEVPFVILFTIGLFIIAGPLGFVPLVLMICYGIVGAFLVGPLRRQNQIAAQKRRAHYQTALETVSNLRLIRSLGCEESWLKQLSAKAAESAKAKRRAGMTQRLLTTLSGAGVPVAGTATVVIGAYEVMAAEMTVGMLIGAMIIIWRVLAPIQQLFLMLSRYAEMAQMMAQIDGMMRLPSSTQVDKGLVKRSFSGQISFDRASFRYQGAPQGTLQGLSFTIRPGMFVAVKGHSGSGKSSLLRLILDLYQPQVGSVQIDGVNVRQIPSENLRAAIGYVPQNPMIFHGTIAQNLRLSAPAASDDKLRCICGEVGLLPAIDSLPRGMDTLLDHARQETLPGGFRQALAIAQALLRESSILLLDEPTKTLDYDLEDALLACLQRRRGTTTIVMVSHRPSHIRLADRVLCLDRGQVTSFDPPTGTGQVAA
ncbi:ATP-binding cassette subfamily C protein/ATP-binding cassette subfamily C protein LapB [Hoeflea marina]|uniref:ATP-binding cassette subfamily C protein/ATP-binding cassette subfamily C protein LapB n=1 Tax=Hoeflea marina TaxID=274592 RepID=A0A317PKQ6_9HYPH|nr:ATP-binding cassette domain-containing protein [Hoeflea marina]PWW00620.1 ATP-binding cassette subfamily C protein/ATP-binding cassette subfamily C protein LapB [Hoeflea marina]